MLPLNGLIKLSAMHKKCPDAPYSIILLCLMPDNFTHQGENAGIQCSKEFTSDKKQSMTPSCPVDCS